MLVSVPTHRTVDLVFHSLIIFYTSHGPWLWMQNDIIPTDDAMVKSCWVGRQSIMCHLLTSQPSFPSIRPPCSKYKLSVCVCLCARLNPPFIRNAVISVRARTTCFIVVMRLSVEIRLSENMDCGCTFTVMWPRQTGKFGEFIFVYWI